jgi:hypothetical protein
VAEQIIKMRCTGHVNQGATRRNPGEVISIEGALAAGQLMRASSAELVDEADRPAVLAALAADDQRKGKVSRL